MLYLAQYRRGVYSAETIVCLNDDGNERGSLTNDDGRAMARIAISWLCTMATGAPTTGVALPTNSNRIFLDAYQSIVDDVGNCIGVFYAF